MKIMHTRNGYNSQAGFALITVLVVLVVGVILAVSAVSSSLMDEKMSGNHRASIMAGMVAEYGIADRFDHVLNLTGTDAQDFKDKVEAVDVTVSCDATVEDLKAPADADWGEGIVVPGEISTGMDGLEYDYYECLQQAWPEDWNVSGEYYAYKVVGRVTSGTETIASDEQVSLYTFFFSPPPNLDPGILAECVESTGNNNFVKGSIHANLEGCLNITLSKKEDPELSSLTEGLEYTIPKVSDFLVYFKDYYGISQSDSAGEYVLDEYVSYPGGVVYSTCSMDSSTPLQAGGEDITMYYCPDPDATMIVSKNFPGDLSYLTMVSEGGIEFNGSSSTIVGADGEELVGMSVIAAGDIDFNGERDSYGLFWADGDIRQNGTSEMNGSIVSSGSVNFQGNIDFDGGIPLALDDLNIFKRVRLFSWSG